MMAMSSEQSVRCSRSSYADGLALGPGSSSQSLWPQVSSRRWGDEAGCGTHGPVDQDLGMRM